MEISTGLYRAAIVLAGLGSTGSPAFNSHLKSLSYRASESGLEITVLTDLDSFEGIFHISLVIFLSVEYIHRQSHLCRRRVRSRRSISDMTAHNALNRDIRLGKVSRVNVLAGHACGSCQ